MSAPVDVPVTYLGSNDGSDGRAREVRYRVDGACAAGELLLALSSSRRVAADVLARGALVRGNERLRRTDRLAAGDVVTLGLASAEPAASADGHGRRGGLVVLWRDAFLMAVDKPTGILVHGDGTGAVTLTDLAADALAAAGEPAVPQAVQRLDVDTTGIVVFSLAPEFQPALDQMVATRGMRKRYLAVVRGNFPEGVRRIDAPLGRDRHDARRMRVSPTGKPAQTLVTPLARRGGHSLLGVELLSGRRHQIRVHLAHVGFPVVGDALYGRGGAAPGLMLHAVAEDFRHPATGEGVRLRTAWPERFGAYFSPGDCAGWVHTVS